MKDKETVKAELLVSGDGVDNSKDDMKKWLDETSTPSSTAAPAIGHGTQQDRGKFIMGLGYMFAMGVCGIVLVALGSTLDVLAEHCGSTSTEMGTVFIARGVGAVFGAIFSAKLYFWFQGNHVMGISLTCLVFFIMMLPSIRSGPVLHFFFFCLGLGTAVTDTGCQIMTRKVHGKTAGPWLGANTVAFGISGALVPLVEIITGSLYVQYTVIVVLIALVALLVICGPNSEQNGRLQAGPPKHADGQKQLIPHYRVEITISLMVFCFIGGKVTSTAYLKTYVEETGVIETSNEAAIVLVLWVAITIGRLVGVYDQRFLTNKSLPIHLSVLCIGGFLAILLILWFPRNAQAFWIGIAFYGLFNGPCVGYCYDWNNRITYPTEVSMSIVMFGLNFGASLVPYITTLIWDHGGGPITLMYTIFFSMFLPLTLLHWTKYLSYDPNVNPNISKNKQNAGYSEIPEEDGDLEHLITSEDDR